MKHKLIGMMAATLVVGTCLLPSAMAQAAEADENTLIYSFPVNTEDSAGFIPANEHEQLAPDAFFVSGDRVFLDDTVNNRILLYRGQSLEKSIPLSSEMDVQLLFYSSEDDVLKMVYWDRFNEYGTHLYLTSVTVSADETVPVGQELSDSSRILLEYSFDSKGNLITEYLTDEGTANALAFSDEDLAVLSEGGTAGREYVGTAINDTCYLYSTYMDGVDKAAIGECIVLNDGSDSFIYALPEMHEYALERGNVQITENEQIFQMTVDATGIKIFKLAQQSAASMKEINLLEREVESISKAAVTPYANYKDMDTATIRERMDTYFNLSWTFNSTRNSDKSVTADPDKVTQPSWITDYADDKDHTLSNVPYCWGG